MKAGKEYEILIEQLYKKLDTDSVIRRNDKIKGYNSGIEREIDISIRRNVGPHEVLMIVQAKDHKDPIDVNVIGEFDAVIKDVRANKGILISRKGFSKPALALAKSLNIDALTGHDLNNPKWTVDLKMPVLLDTYEGSFTVEFALEISQSYEDMAREGKTPQAPALTDFRISEDGGKTFHSIREKFEMLCTNNHLQFYDGVEHTAEFMGSDLQLYIMEGVLTPLREFKFKYRVTRQTHYKYFEVKEFQGFINRETNVISRVNLKVDSDEFTVSNYDITLKKEVDLSTWKFFDASVTLIHPYTIKCALIQLQMPRNFQFIRRQ